MANGEDPDPPPAGEELDALGNPLRVEDEDYELVDEAAVVAVHRSSTLDEARAIARELIEHGFGATVTPGPGTGDGDGDAGGYDVAVLPEEADRASRLLAEGADFTTAPAETPVVKEPVPWKRVALIWVAAMILLPLIAGVGTYLISR